MEGMHPLLGRWGWGPGEGDPERPPLVCFSLTGRGRFSLHTAKRNGGGFSAPTEPLSYSKAAFPYTTTSLQPISLNNSKTIRLCSPLPSAFPLHC